MPSTSPPTDLYPLIFDSLREGVFTVDRDFKITSFNAEAERITGVPRHLATGRKCHEVFRANICQTGCALKETLATGQPIHDVRVDVVNASLSAVPISVSTAILRKGSRMVGGVEIFRDISELVSLRSELAEQGSFADMVGVSPAMQKVFRLIPDVAACDAPVLIEGPTGTGKELVARAIHDLSPRREGPFVRVNCGALPDTLLESELFGYVRGAFTDARRDKPGHFMLAQRGTILLDEIADVTPAFQVKLLRVLQEAEVQPLGSTRAIKLDVRVLAATNRDLGAMVRSGQFREDLYYRVRVIPVVMPALRERRQDVPLLVEHFLKRMAVRLGKIACQVAPRAMAALGAYDYPGNVRELENILQRAVVLSRGQRIELRHLPAEMLVAKSESGTYGNTLLPSRKPSERQLLGLMPPAGPAAASTDQTLADAVARRLRAALDAHGWNRTNTAHSLGMARNTLWRRMREHGLLR
jgi:PAS domain S-box-containing protein